MNKACDTKNVHGTFKQFRALLMNNDLSLKAKGLVAVIVTENREVFRLSDTIEQAKEGGGSIRKAMKELEKNGYAKIGSVSDQKGKFTGRMWNIYLGGGKENG